MENRVSRRGAVFKINYNNLWDQRPCLQRPQIAGRHQTLTLANKYLQVMICMLGGHDCVSSSKISPATGYQMAKIPQEWSPDLAQRKVKSTGPPVAENVMYFYGMFIKLLKWTLRIWIAAHLRPSEIVFPTACTPTSPLWRWRAPVYILGARGLYEPRAKSPCFWSLTHAPI
jgi:hypothetical protein